MKSLEVFSPAKLNLYLDVLRKRPDGYHDLFTLFERILLGDKIRLTRTKSGPIVIISKSPHIPCDERNLAYKAADLIRTRHEIKSGLRIEIKKNIPVGGGLGGGSSNAASVLMACNKLFGLKLAQKTLVGCANELGSDVAFFVLNKSFAVGQGRGGDLTPIPLPSRVKLWHVLFVAPIPVLTKDVYRKLKIQKILRLTKWPSNVNILLSCLRKGERDALDRLFYNRLCEVVYKSYTLVSDLRTDLCKSGLKNVHMSGSGPTLFSVFATERQARLAASKARRRFHNRCHIFLASTW